MKPIPMPFHCRWREFRFVYLPRLAFLIVFVAMLFIWTRRIVPSPTIAHEVEVVAVQSPSIVKDSAP